MPPAIGTCTIIEELYGGVKLINWHWFGGTAEESVGACTTSAFYSGKLLYCVTVVGSSAADNYDIAVWDKNDVDLLSSSGLNRSDTSAQSITVDNLGAVANSQLELQVAASGSAGTEDAYLYLWIR